MKFACKKGSRNIRITGQQGCIPFEPFGGKVDPMWIGPQDNGHGLSLTAILGASCISRVVYQDVDGVVVRSTAAQIPVS